MCEVLNEAQKMNRRKLIKRIRESGGLMWGACTTYTQKEAGGTDNHTPPPGTAKDRVFTFDCVVNKSSD